MSNASDRLHTPLVTARKGAFTRIVSDELIATITHYSIESGRLENDRRGRVPDVGSRRAPLENTLNRLSFKIT